MRAFGPEPPWRGYCHIEGRTLRWAPDEDLWDGTQVWLLIDQPTPSFLSVLMSRLPTLRALDEKVAWLEDDYLLAESA